MASAVLAPPPPVAPAQTKASFVVNRKALAETVALAQSVRESNTTLPILACLLLRADPSGKLSIYGTDLDQSLFATCEARVASGGTFCVPSRKLHDYLRLLDGEEVTFAQLDNDWVQIRSGRSKTKMVGMSAAKFPAIAEFPATASARLPVSMLRKLLARVSFAIPTQESKLTLNSAQLELEAGSATMVATDGHRLSYARGVEQIAGVAAPSSHLIALKGVRQLASLLGNTQEEFIDFAAAAAALFFRVGPTVYSIRKLTGQFPNYRAVLPTSIDKQVILSVSEFASTVQRVAQFADDRAPVIRFAIERDSARVSSANLDLGESEETLTTAYAGEALAIGLNSSYVLDILKVIGSSEVKVQFSSTSAAVEFCPETPEPSFQYRALVMPARV